jgi:hypothetical protein
MDGLLDDPSIFNAPFEAEVRQETGGFRENSSFGDF